ncbi:MAG: hypothetical protein WCS89_01895 [Candidatus Paceibacterota bacterium]
MKQKLRTTRVVTYRRYGIPALILEGKWLTEKYRLIIGDLVDIDYQPKEIRLKKNVPFSRERQIQLKEKEELRKQRIQESLNDTITRKNENFVEGGGEVSEG